MSFRKWVQWIAFAVLSAYFTHFVLVDPKDGLLAVGYRHFGQVLLTVFMAIVPALFLSWFWVTVAALVVKALLVSWTTLVRIVARRPVDEASNQTIDFRGGSASMDDRVISEAPRGDPMTAGPADNPILAALARAHAEADAEADYKSVAEKLLGLFTARHFTGDSDAVVQALEEFLTPRLRSLFFEQNHLGAAARIMVDCKDTPSIRAWSVDLLGRVGTDADIPRIVEMANDDDDAKVRQEATAALGKYLRFRSPGPGARAAIRFTRDESDGNVVRARGMVQELLG